MAANRRTPLLLHTTCRIVAEVLSDNLLTVDEERIKDIVVLKTILGGQVVYEKAE
jgi:hypothetical protein